MNLLDAFIILPIGYFAYKGFLNGFIKEFFGIAGLVIAIFATFNYMGPVAGFLAPFAEDKDKATMIAGVTIFLFTLAVVIGVGFWLDKLFDVVSIGFINQIAGFFFGAFKTALFISAILLLLAGFNTPGKETRMESATYPKIIYLAPAAFDLVAGIYPDTRDFIDTIERSIRENNTLRELPIFDKSENDL